MTPGSLGVIERLIRSLKDECTRRIIVPVRRDAFRREVLHYIFWYQGCRPHASLFGPTPDEVHYERPPQDSNRVQSERNRNLRRPPN
ncbi:MAG: hypothetical protein AB1486_03100 [Planctomycetota bacterium]